MLRGRFKAALDLTPPGHLQADASREWERLAPLLAKAGIIVETDLAGLAILCTLRAEERRTKPTDPRWLELVHELLEWEQAYLLTPAARAKAGYVPPPGGAAS